MQNKITIYGLFIFILGALFYFYDFVLQVSPGVMAYSLRHEFQITASLLGTMSSVYFYSYTIMQIPAGLLLDRFGAKNILPIVISVCAIGALIFGCAPYFSLIGVGRLLMGAGSAFAFLGSLYLAIRWLPSAYFAFFAGVTQMIGSLGAIGGESPLAYLIDHIGWRKSMVIFAIAGLVLAALTRVFISETQSMHQFAQEYSKGKVWLNFKTVLCSNTTWKIGIYSFANWAPIAAFAGLWGVPFLRNTYHLTNINAANGIAILWLAVAFACPTVGWLSELIKRRVVILTALSTIGFVSILLLIYVPAQSHTAVFLELAGIGISASGQSLSFALIKDEQPLYLTGAANGFNNMMIVIGGAIFQPLIGLLLDLHHSGLAVGHAYSAEDFRSALFVLPLLYLLGIIVSSVFVRETYCKAAYANEALSI